ncbi:hypothetical protein [Microbacterium flavum]|uniref:Uncharacterized protein n=1 Tax=Microbacterium flavum TaxID=415216 RepID=A0ABS5XVS4_9MICO|nr:hypothetical protein [Microbacterium flavum]MBT8798642.1 hypothetical protein [Microbacterium flavum]
MSDQLFSFGSDAVHDAHPPQVMMMSDAQRATIRALFEELGVPDAKSQFAIVGELTGTTIGSVNELTASAAARLINSLRSRIAALGQSRTGNAWVDREEDTWIDRL